MRIDGWLPVGHPGDGIWRAFLDGELPADQQRRLAQHLKSCRRCRRRYAAIQAQAAWVAARLGALRAVAAAAPLPDPARWTAALGAYPEAVGKGGETRPEAFPRSRRRWSAGRIAAAAAALALALGLATPSLRAAASQWITIFRAQEARTLRISLEDLRQLLSHRQALAGRLAQLTGLVQVEPAASPEVERNLTPADLRARGLTVPGYLPAGFALQEATYFQTPDTRVRVDVDGVNRLLESLGRSERLPEALKGQVLRLQPGQGYLLRYRRGEEWLEILQTDLPVLAAGGPVDINQVVRAFAGLLGDQLGVSAALWQQLESVDLRRTLPLPLLEGSNGTEVKVRGAAGTYHEGSGRGALLWVADERIHLVEGPLPKAELMRIAESIGSPEAE